MKKLYWCLLILNFCFGIGALLGFASCFFLCVLISVLFLLKVTALIMHYFQRTERAWCLGLLASWFIVGLVIILLNMPTESGARRKAEYFRARTILAQIFSVLKTYASNDAPFIDAKEFRQYLSQQNAPLVENFIFLDVDFRTENGNRIMVIPKSYYPGHPFIFLTQDGEITALKGEVLRY